MGVYEHLAWVSPFSFFVVQRSPKRIARFLAISAALYRNDEINTNSSCSNRGRASERDFIRPAAKCDIKGVGFYKHH